MENISIVLPCYNHGKYVAKSIESILSQTYKEFILYVFDNGSEDNSWEEINKFDDERVKKIRLEKNDILEVKKRFIEQAMGKYFAIAHADDFWLDTKLEKQMAYINKNRDVRVCVAWPRYLEIDDSGEVLNDKSEFFQLTNASVKEWYRRLFLEENRIAVPSLVCDRDIYVKYFGTIYPYRQLADVFTWLKILEETNIHVVEEPLLVQHLHKSKVGMNESYPTIRNLARGDVEGRYAKYQVIDEMSDEIFLKIFCSNDANNAFCTHMDVLCKKFLFFARDPQGQAHGYENAVRFYDTYFAYQEDGKVFFQYLDNKYGFSREDFFKHELLVTSSTMTKDCIINRWYLLENTDITTLKYPSKPISIYGCAKGGKAFCKRIKPYCLVRQFIDRTPLINDYLGVPVVKIDKANLSSDDIVVVIPSYDFEWVVEELMGRYKDISRENMIPFEDFMQTGKIIDPYF